MALDQACSFRGQTDTRAGKATPEQRSASDCLRRMTDVTLTRHDIGGNPPAAGCHKGGAG